MTIQGINPKDRMMNAHYQLRRPIAPTAKISPNLRSCLMFSKILDFMVSEKGRKALIAVSIASAAFFTLAAILVFAGVIY